jgi:hypothetical protein
MNTVLNYLSSTTYVVHRIRHGNTVALDTPETSLLKAGCLGAPVDGYAVYFRWRIVFRLCVSGVYIHDTWIVRELSPSGGKPCWHRPSLGERHGATCTTLNWSVSGTTRFPKGQSPAMWRRGKSSRLTGSEGQTAPPKADDKPSENRREWHVEPEPGSGRGYP